MTKSTDKASTGLAKINAGGLPPAPTGTSKDTTPASAPPHADTTPVANGAGQGGITITLPTHAAAEPKEATSRLSLDIPESLHLAIKMSCLQRRVTILDDVSALLEQVYRPKA